MWRPDIGGVLLAQVQLLAATYAETIRHCRGRKSRNMSVCFNEVIKAKLDGGVKQTSGYRASSFPAIVRSLSGKDVT